MPPTKTTAAATFSKVNKTMYTVLRASIFSLGKVERVYENTKQKNRKPKSVCGEAKHDHKKLKKENQSYNKLLTSTSNIILAGFGGFGGSSSFVLTRYLAAVREKQNKSAKIAFMTFLLGRMITVRVTNVLISNCIIKKSQHSENVIFINYGILSVFVCSPALL